MKAEENLQLSGKPVDSVDKSEDENLSKALDNSYKNSVSDQRHYPPDMES